MLTLGVYWWDLCYHIAYMDPIWVILLVSIGLDSEERRSLAAASRLRRFGVLPRSSLGKTWCGKYREVLPQLKSHEDFHFHCNGEDYWVGWISFHQFSVICRRCSLDPMKIHMDLKRTEITIDLGFLVTSRRDLTDMIVFLGVTIPTNRLISG